MVPVALGVTILAFFMIHLVRGDPPPPMLGIRATNSAVAVLHHRWGLDQPLPAQYFLFMGRLVHGDLGDSLFYRVPTTGLILGRLPATPLLLLYAAVLSVLVAAPPRRPLPPPSTSALFLNPPRRAPLGSFRFVVRVGRV